MCLCPLHLYVAPAQASAQECAVLVRGGDVDDPTSGNAASSQVPIPTLAAVARGIRRDRQAVEVARTEGWSKGHVEGLAN